MTEHDWASNRALIKQIARATESAQPTRENPAWCNTHLDLQRTLVFIEQLEDEISRLCMLIADMKMNATHAAEIYDDLEEKHIRLLDNLQLKEQWIRLARSKLSDEQLLEIGMVFQPKPVVAKEQQQHG